MAGDWIRLRYRLLPYVLAESEAAAAAGLPFDAVAVATALAAAIDGGAGADVLFGFVGTGTSEAGADVAIKDGSLFFAPFGASDRLRGAGLANDEARRGDYRFLATGDPEEFRRLGTRFLQLPLGDVEHISLRAGAAAWRRARAAGPVDG